MKVCHFTSSHKKEDQRIFHKECASLAKAGYEVYLVAQGTSEETQGIHIIGTGEEIKARYYRLLIRPMAIYWLAKKIDADIYHFHDMELIPYGLKLKHAGKKVIFDYHEDFASIFADSDAPLGPRFLKKIFAKLYAWYEKQAIRQFNAMISVSPHICDRLRRENLNTLMITNYPLLKGDWNKQPYYHNNSNYIFFAGQISDFYNVTFITEAIQNIPDIKFKICGFQRKDGDLKKVLDADANHKVNYLGMIPYMQIPELFRGARCAIVLTSYGNNYGGNIGTLGVNKLFEAMLCGTPVICTDYILWKEIIENWHCGICVNPYKQEELRTAVEYIISHPKEAEEMGKNGHNAVKEFYNWESQQKLLLGLYEKL